MLFVDNDQRKYHLAAGAESFQSLFACDDEVQASIHVENRIDPCHTLSQCQLSCRYSNSVWSDKYYIQRISNEWACITAMVEPAVYVFCSNKFESFCQSFLEFTFCGNF